MSRPRSMILRAFSFSKRRFCVATRKVSERSFVSWLERCANASTESPMGFHFVSRLAPRSLADSHGGLADPGQDLPADPLGERTLDAFEPGLHLVAKALTDPLDPLQAVVHRGEPGREVRVDRLDQHVEMGAGRLLRPKEQVEDPMLAALGLRERPPVQTVANLPVVQDRLEVLEYLEPKRGGAAAG